MKKLFFTTAILFSCLTFKVATAQIHISLGLNIASQPDWGPVGYDHAAYYYIPDIGAYYDVQAHQYIYLVNGRWVHVDYLPARYSNYDLYSGYKVVINDRNPWLNDRVYRTRYARYRGRHDQVVIRNSHDPKYRNHYMDKRARDLNMKQHQQNVRANHLDQRTQHLNQRAKHLNQKAKQEKKDDKHNDKDHHQ